MDPSGIVAVTAVAFVLGFLYYRQRRRRADIRALATRLGFTFIGSALPRSLSLARTELAACSSVWNVIDGESRGVRMIAFDCQIGRGKGRWRRTVVAVQSSAGKFDATGFSYEVTTERSGEWTLLYQPKTLLLIPLGLMPISELEAYLSTIKNRPTADS
jgi:hypothetical protein